jgi:hypothetical protein
MSRKKSKQSPKRVLRLPDLDCAKSAVLNTLRSPESKRSYRFAIDNFVAWYCSEPRIAFNRQWCFGIGLSWSLGGCPLRQSTSGLRPCGGSQRGG